MPPATPAAAVRRLLGRGVLLGLILTTMSCVVAPIPIPESSRQFQWVEHEDPNRRGFLIFTLEKKLVMPEVYLGHAGLQGGRMDVSKTHFQYFLTTQEDQARSLPGTMVPYDISKEPSRSGQVAHFPRSCASTATPDAFRGCPVTIRLGFPVIGNWAT
jgi:hypothetical protein